MSKDKLIVITICICLSSLLLINFNYVYAFVYKTNAKNMVKNRMKEKYNINVKITEVKNHGYDGLFSSITSKNTVEFVYNNEKYYATVNSAKLSNKVYDNYQYDDIVTSFANYLKEVIGAEYRQITLEYYNDEVNNGDKAENNDNKIIGLVYDEFKDDNYNQIFKNGELTLQYDEIVDDDLLREIFSSYSNNFKINISEYNKEIDSKDSRVNEITCISNNIYINYNSNIDRSKYRLDFGNIIAFGKKEALEGSSIEKIPPFDLNQIEEYDSNNYRVVSDYYKTVCNDKDSYVEFFIPGDYGSKDNYKVATYSVRNGTPSYDIHSISTEEKEGYLGIVDYCFNDYMEHVILKSKKS